MDCGKLRVGDRKGHAELMEEQGIVSHPLSCSECANDKSPTLSLNGALGASLAGAQPSSLRSHPCGAVYT